MPERGYDLITRSGRLNAGELERAARRVRDSAHFGSSVGGTFEGSHGTLHMLDPALADNPPGGGGKPGKGSFVGGKVVANFAPNSVAPGGILAVTWDNTAEYDTGGFFNFQQPTYLTAPAAGYYSLGVQISWTSGIQNDFYVRKNGGNFPVLGASYMAWGAASTELILGTGDHLELIASNRDQGFSQSLQGATGYAPATGMWLRFLGTVG